MSKIKDRTGEYNEKINAKIIKYINAHEIYVEFQDEFKQVKKCEYKDFINSKVENLEDKKIKYKSKIGEISPDGRCKIIDYKDYSNVVIEFNDDNKLQKLTTYFNFKNNKIKNPFEKTYYKVAFLGSGNFKSKINGVTTKEYTHWSSMLSRVYNEKFKKKHKCYDGCTLSDEWHNFQKFAEWFSTQKYKDGWHLDKDFLNKDNKHYSKENCIFLPSEINFFLTNNKKTNKTGFIGVSEKNSGFQINGSCFKTKKMIYLGVEKTLHSASLLYEKQRKEQAKKAYEFLLAEGFEESIAQKILKR